jgi:hypothetical protein
LAALCTGKGRAVMGCGPVGSDGDAPGSSIFVIGSADRITLKADARWIIT